ITEALVSAAHTRYPDAPMPQSWEIAVFENATPNAFALPGGKIGVHSGLLELAENQAQLATVIGHEIAHVLADHGNERLTQELGLQAGMLLVGLFTESEIAENQIQQALGIGAQLGITLPFSRAHEEEADLMGLEIMARAGFEPGQSVRLWQNMAQASGAQPLEFLSTHPNHDTRIASLQNQLETARSVFETVPPADCQI
ncbi:MAG TPA: peptidase, partial [Marinobacter adhaerens]|nr:peptidase [Marinobacter adhaerens]